MNTNIFTKRDNQFTIVDPLASSHSLKIVEISISKTSHAIIILVDDGHDAERDKKIFPQMLFHLLIAKKAFEEDFLMMMSK